MKRLLEQVWIEDRVPETWKTASIVPFFNGCRDQSFALPELCALRGCRDESFALQQIIEQRHEYSRHTHMSFIDFKAAFDSLSEDVIWKICTSLEIAEKVISILKAMYSETFSQVRANKPLSRKFQIRAGVRQGSVLSPLLFIMGIKWIMKNALADKNFGLELDNATVTDLDFADDICQPEDDEDKAQELLTRVSESASKTGLVINVKKTKAISTKDNINLIHNKERFEVVQSFCYLGSTMTIDMTTELNPKFRVVSTKPLETFGHQERLQTQSNENYMTPASGKSSCTVVNHGL